MCLLSSIMFKIEPPLSSSYIYMRRRDYLRSIQLSQPSSQSHRCNSELIPHGETGLSFRIPSNKNFSIGTKD